MKSLTLMPLVALLASTTQISAQAGRRVSVELPTFKSPEAALEWAKNQISAAQKVAATPASEGSLMKAASASRVALEWKDASKETRVEAALVCAEAFLGLNAPQNADSVMARVDGQDAKNTPLAAAFFERAGEAAELRGDRRGAHLAYQIGLGAAPSVNLKPLLLYRAGTNAFSLAEHKKSAAFLEEALAVLPDGSQRASMAAVALGGAYVALKDRVRAEAWLLQATRTLDRRAKGGPATTTEIQTFIPEPSDDEIRKRIGDVEKVLRGLNE